MRLPTGAIAALICLTLVACANEHVEAAKQAVRSRLSDPSSAQFDRMTVFPGDIVCGTVNAKNKLGGYVGPRVFVYNGSERGQAIVDADQGTVDYYCSADNVWAQLAVHEKRCAATPPATPASQSEFKETCKKVEELRASLAKR